MSKGRLVLVGATGDVGVGVVAATVARGWDVVAVARGAQRLNALGEQYDSQVSTIVGTIADEDSCARLAAEIGEVDAVVLSIHPSYPHRPILEWPVDEFNATLTGNVGAHLAAARHLMPIVRDGGDYLGLGGGMADLVVPKWVPLAVAQAAQRQLYRGLVRENWRNARVRVRELLVRSIVNGPSTRAQARPEWLTDREIGEHVADLLDEPTPTSAPTAPPEESSFILEMVSPRGH